MARHRFNGIFTDGYGNVISGGLVVVTLTGTATVANLYLASSGGSPVTSVTTASDGSFWFYMDDTEYGLTQKFDITLSKTGFTTKTYVEEGIISTNHARSHVLTSTSDHTSTATSGQMLKADANGLPVDGTNTDTDVASAVSLKHTRSHVITGSSDHTSTATAGQVLKADANGLPVDATNTDADVASAVSLKHSQNTDSGTTGNTFTVDSDSATGKIVVDVALGAADKSLTITNAPLTDNRVVTFQDLTGTVALTSDLHTKQHAITSTADHTSTATSGKMLKADANGLPIDATNTDTDVADAVSKKHTQGTDTGTSGDTFAVGDGTGGADKKLIAQNADANKPYLAYDEATNSWVFSNDGSTETTMVGAGAVTFASAAEELAGVEAAKASSPSVSREMIINLKPVVNAAVNKLDIFTKSGGAAPDATNPIKVMIPDGNGYTQRSRTGAVASGTGQIVLADAANYWSKGSLDAEIKTAYLYAIWSTADAGIVWALAGYAGFTRVPAAGGAATDDDWFLLEGSSSYTAVITDYCVCVAKIRYQYDTADTPDHTIQATVLDAPQVIWNPKSDYGYSKTLASTVSSGSDIAEASRVSSVVKQTGVYFIHCSGHGLLVGGTFYMAIVIKTGSATYGSATQKSIGRSGSGQSSQYLQAVVASIVKLNNGDTIHLGATVQQLSGGTTRNLYGDDDAVGSTILTFQRID